MEFCPKCNGRTSTYRHSSAKIWCTKCGFVVREENGPMWWEKKIEQLRAENERLRTALKDAAKSLQAISVNAGRRNEYMEDFLQVRGYANSRAGVVFKALNEEADDGEGSR